MEHMRTIIDTLKRIEAFAESKIGESFSVKDAVTIYGMTNDCISAIRRREKVMKCENCWHYNKMDEYAGRCENKADNAPIINTVSADFYCKNFHNGPKNREI